MKKNPKTIKPGDMLDGRRGDWHRPAELADGCQCRQHMKDIKDDKGNVIRSYVCGLELVSKTAHWWLDEESEHPELQQGDWDFRVRLDSRDNAPLVPLDNKYHSWQLPWAWEYECWREWQPRSDFDDWRRKWRKEVKRLLDPSGDWIRGKVTKEEAERDAAFSYGERLPLWLLRDFTKYFPKTPWVNIPHDKRRELKHVRVPGSTPIPIDGSLLSLKEPDPNSKGLPPIPEKLRIENKGVISLRQPDPNNAEEVALYAEWRRQRSEVLRRQAEWSDTTAPGRYRHEVVKEITPGQFAGTYIIYIPWYQTDDDLKAGFAAWLRKKESELGPAGCRKKFSLTGWDKPYAALKQLGALRLLRSGPTAEQAAKNTQDVLGKPLFSEKGFSTAKGKADDNLAKFFSVG